MNGFILLLFVGMLSLSGYCQPLILTELRSKYIEARNGKGQCTEFAELARKYRNPIIVETEGYYACSKMMMAKYYLNPFSKFSEFNDGVKLLEKAIQLVKDNVELIYLRYTIQTQVPEFLGYNNQMQGDKAFLLKEVKKIEEIDLRTRILAYLRYSKYVSLQEKKQLL